MLNRAAKVEKEFKQAEKQSKSFCLFYFLNRQGLISVKVLEILKPK